MPRIARLVVPGYPHHIIQRGNRRQDVFFSNEDKIVYIDYLHTYAKEAGKDKLLSDHFLISEIKDWSAYLSEEDKQEDVNILQKHSNTGRPLGGIKFIEKIEKLAGRALKKKKPGPKRNN
ncbi:MAG: hypothetical protein U9Q08_04345 [Candidatus Omnitrophota bacterium]|nr:hypothetical protein [Candidatus Omnitrophota bacterium]